jgi:uncharacterized protein YndB with AHSA1/START domain
MPTAQRTRTIAASRQELWAVVGDPHHIPRWWPRVSRVEAVEDEAFTEVLKSEKGKMVRADFRRLEVVPGQRIVWAQQIEDTPFARILTSAETEIRLAPLEASKGTASGGLGGAADDGSGEIADDGSAVEAAGGGPAATEVTIELRQTLRGFLARLGGHLVRRAAGSTIEEALDGLERIVGKGA